MAYKGNSMQAVDHEPENVWLWRQRLLHYSLSAIRDMAEAPAVRDELGRYSLEGGLGKVMGLSTVSRRLQIVQKEHHEELLEAAGTYRALALEQLDLKSRLALSQIERCRRAVDRALVHDVFDERAEAALTKALAVSLRIDERRAKLLGLDAPIEVHAEVVHTDPVAIELAAMLEKA